ncbi:unnamed protein product [Tilletia laevis]|nr:unnamed protein product [Tilletia laevis]
MSSTLPLVPPPPFSGDDSFSSEFTAASSADSASPIAQQTEPAPDPEGGAAPIADGPAPLAPAAAVATGPCQWSSTESELMLTVLEEAAMQKLQSGGGFKPEVWRKASDKLAATWVKGGTKGPEQVKTHFRGLKKMWAEVHELVNMSGFVWDEKQKRVTALDSVWDDLLANKPKFKKWKNRTFEYYDRMTALCAKYMAMDSYARDAGGKESEESGEDKSEDGDSSDDDAMAGPADDEDEVGVVMEELLELDGDNFDVDELATLGLALAEKPKLIAMYRSLKERDAMRLAFIRKILAAN